MVLRRQFYEDAIVLKVAIAVALIQGPDRCKEVRFSCRRPEHVQQEKETLLVPLCQLLLCLKRCDYETEKMTNIVNNLSKAMNSKSENSAISQQVVYKSLISFFEVERLSRTAEVDREMTQTAVCLLAFYLNIEQQINLAKEFVESLHRSLMNRRNVDCSIENPCVLQSDYLMLGVVDYTLQRIVCCREKFKVGRKRKPIFMEMDSLTLQEEYIIRDLLLYFFEHLYLEMNQTVHQNNPERIHRIYLAQAYLCYIICSFLELQK